MSTDLALLADPTALALLADDIETARDFARGSLAENTRASYLAQVGLWEAFAAKRGFVPYPAAAENVAAWLGARASQGNRGGRRGKGTGQAYSTIVVGLVAVRVAHRFKGLTIDDPRGLVRQTLAGIRRATIEPRAQVKPLRATVILPILRHALEPGASLDLLRDAALLGVGYAFARRKSELTGLDWAERGQGTGWIETGATECVLHLMRHKTEMKIGATSIVVPRAENGVAFAVLDAWVKAAGIRPGTPVLRRMRKGGGIGSAEMNPKSIGPVIKRRIAQHLIATGVPEDMAQREADLYSGHSMRHGFVTTAVENDADLESIRNVTRHSGDRELRTYYTQADQRRINAHRTPGVGLKE